MNTPPEDVFVEPVSDDDVIGIGINLTEPAPGLS